MVCALKYICRKPCLTTSFTFLLYGSTLTSLNSNFLQSLELYETVCFRHISKTPGISRASSASLCLVPQQRALTCAIRLSIYYGSVQYGMVVWRILIKTITTPIPDHRDITFKTKNMHLQSWVAEDLSHRESKNILFVCVSGTHPFLARDTCFETAFLFCSSFVAPILVG